MAIDTREGGGRKLASEVRFGVLGPLTVTEGHAAVNIGGPKQRTVLAMLIAHAGDPVSVDTIIEAVWGDDAAPNARRIVQTYVATLRGGVGDSIAKTGTGWRLEVPRDAIDGSAFEDLYQSAREIATTNPQRASVALREALAIWRGHPYADVEAHGALTGEISRLSELRVAAQAARVDADLALGRDADLVGEIEAFMAEHPYSERFRAQQMLALYRAGRQQEALRSYQHMRTVLLEELGVDPTPDLQELERRILDQDDSLRLAPAQTIQRRAILVADPGDPIDIGHLPAAEREELLTRTTRAVRDAIAREGDGASITAGTTSYVIFDSARAAANVAEEVTRRLDGGGMRLAIDWGDLVLENGRVSGPPVSRAAVMAAVAHKGQVLLSADAQQAIGTSGSGRGLRFENLGSHDLYGVEGSLLIYQLLIGDMPAVFPNLETHRLPPPLPGGGDRSVPGYELREALGPGSIGMFYRAFQPSMGREVLIEVIGQGDSSDAEFIRNFEADAQRLSLLDHQNIAPVIDYWRQPDGAFLVYRFPRGGLLSDGDAADAGRLVDQIGSALSYAHSLGMVHGTLRPDRVALDEAGNAALLGFSVAGVAPPHVDDYERYVAPETWAGAAPTVASDIYALGALARELGFDDPFVDRATDDDPRRRPTNVAEFLVELNPVRSGSAADRYTETRNPYKGLAAFHERDVLDFFGRSTAVEELCMAMLGSRLLAIVGPSGIGKSSIARAGLVPALRSGRLPGSETWLITDMFPGSHPFLELHRALERVAVDLPVALTEDLAAQRPEALGELTGVLPQDADLVVLIDQFEELFTMVPEPERQAFLDLIAFSVETTSVRFVLTLRADFLDRPLRYSGFGGVFKESTVMLAAPNPDELAEAIARPAQGVGVTMAPELAERMVAEVRDRPGALPLLQHTLAELFRTRRSDLIGIAAFDEVGGVSGSLARQAESIFGDLDDQERETIKQVFLRLVTIIVERAPTRRRLRVTELADLDAQAPIDAFARQRMLVFDNDPETRSPTVEVAHEALLTHWPRLAAWIDATREDLALLRRLDEARLDWEANGRDPAYVLTGGRLAQHEAWTTTTMLALSEPETAYLETSRQHDERLKGRSRRRRSFIMGGFAALAAVALVFAFSASRNAADARVRALTQAALNITADDPELAVLLAAEAVEVAQSNRARPPAETLGALWSAYTDHRLVARFEGLGGGAVAFSTDGRLIAVDSPGTGEGEVHLIDWHTGEVHATLPPLEADSASYVTQIDYSPDGSLIVVARGGETNGDGVVDVFSAETFEMVSRLGGFAREYFSVDFADDGALVGLGWLGDEDWSLTMWDPLTGREQSHIPDLRRLVGGEISNIPQVHVIPDTHEAVVGVVGDESGSVAFIDLELATVKSVPVNVEPTSIALSPDGTMLAVGGGSVSVFDTATWEPIIDTVVHSDPQTLVWSSDGMRLAVSGNDSDVTIVSVPLGTVIVLSGHQGSVYRTAFHPTDEFLASVSVDNDVRVWDVSHAGPASVEEGASILSVDGTPSGELPDCSEEPEALSPDGRYALLVWIQDDEECAKTADHAVLFDTLSQEEVADFGDANLFSAAVTSPTEFDGQQFVALTRIVSETSTELEIWSVDPVERIGVVDMAMAGGLPLLGVSASPSGRYLGIGTNGPRSVVVDLAALLSDRSIEDAIVFNAETHIGNAPLARVTDGGLIASGGLDGYYRWWDLETSDLVFEIEVDDLKGYPAHDFTSDGRYYHYEDSDGVIRRIPTDIDEMVEQALGSVTRDFTNGECRRYITNGDCVNG